MTVLRRCWSLEKRRPRQPGGCGWSSSLPVQWCTAAGHGELTVPETGRWVFRERIPEKLNTELKASKRHRRREEGRPWAARGRRAAGERAASESPGARSSFSWLWRWDRCSSRHPVPRFAESDPLRPAPPHGLFPPPKTLPPISVPGGRLLTRQIVFITPLHLLTWPFGAFVTTVIRELFR